VGTERSHPVPLPHDLTDRPDVRSINWNELPIAECCQADIAVGLSDAAGRDSEPGLPSLWSLWSPCLRTSEMNRYAATEATKATKAELCGFQPTYVRAKRHYVAIQRVTGRPAVFT
jgi:hypothetical protein